ALLLLQLRDDVLLALDPELPLDPVAGFQALGHLGALQRERHLHGPHLQSRDGLVVQGDALLLDVHGDHRTLHLVLIARRALLVGGVLPLVRPAAPAAGEGEQQRQRQQGEPVSSSHWNLLLSLERRLTGTEGKAPARTARSSAGRAAAPVPRKWVSERLARAP